jgi:predicted CDP-diglyceride synthetase/phosphatidate cytidylyltransferase
MLNVIMVSVAFYLCYADGRSAERLITIYLLVVTHGVNIVHYCSGKYENGEIFS